MPKPNVRGRRRRLSSMTANDDSVELVGAYLSSALQSLLLLTRSIGLQQYSVLETTVDNPPMWLRLRWKRDAPPPGTYTFARTVDTDELAFTWNSMHDLLLSRATQLHDATISHTAHVVPDAPQAVAFTGIDDGVMGNVDPGVDTFASLVQHCDSLLHELFCASTRSAYRSALARLHRGLQVLDAQPLTKEAGAQRKATERPAHMGEVLAAPLLLRLLAVAQVWTFPGGDGDSKVACAASGSSPPTVVDPLQLRQQHPSLYRWAMRCGRCQWARDSAPDFLPQRLAEHYGRAWGSFVCGRAVGSLGLGPTTWPLHPKWPHVGLWLTLWSRSLRDAVGRLWPGETAFEPDDTAASVQATDHRVQGLHMTWCLFVAQFATLVKMSHGEDAAWHLVLMDVNEDPTQQEVHSAWADWTSPEHAEEAYEFSLAYKAALLASLDMCVPTVMKSLYRDATLPQLHTIQRAMVATSLQVSLTSVSELWMVASLEERTLLVHLFHTLDEDRGRCEVLGEQGAYNVAACDAFVSHSLTHFNTSFPSEPVDGRPADNTVLAKPSQALAHALFRMQLCAGPGDWRGIMSRVPALYGGCITNKLWPQHTLYAWVALYDVLPTVLRKAVKEIVCPGRRVKVPGQGVPVEGDVGDGDAVTPTPSVTEAQLSTLLETYGQTWMKYIHPFVIQLLGYDPCVAWESTAEAVEDFRSSSSPPTTMDDDKDPGATESTAGDSALTRLRKPLFDTLKRNRSITMCALLTFSDAEALECLLHGVGSFWLARHERGDHGFGTAFVPALMRFASDRQLVAVWDGFRQACGPLLVHWSRIATECCAAKWAVWKRVLSEAEALCAFRKGKARPAEANGSQVDAERDQEGGPSSLEEEEDGGGGGGGGSEVEAGWHMHAQYEGIPVVWRCVNQLLRHEWEAVDRLTGAVLKGLGVIHADDVVTRWAEACALHATLAHCKRAALERISVQLPGDVVQEHEVSVRRLEELSTSLLQVNATPGEARADALRAWYDDFDSFYIHSCATLATEELYCMPKFLTDVPLNALRRASDCMLVTMHDCDPHVLAHLFEMLGTHVKRGRALHARCIGSAPGYGGHDSNAWTNGMRMHHAAALCRLLPSAWATQMAGQLRCELSASKWATVVEAQPVMDRVLPKRSMWASHPLWHTTLVPLLWVLVHRYFRLELRGTMRQLGLRSGAQMVPEQTTAVLDRAHRFFRHLDKHSEVEDCIIIPEVVRKVPELAQVETWRAEHRTVEALELRIISAYQVAYSFRSSNKASRHLKRMRRSMCSYQTTLLPHLKKEEEHFVPLLLSFFHHDELQRLQRSMLEAYEDLFDAHFVCRLLRAATKPEAEQLLTFLVQHEEDGVSTLPNVPPLEEIGAEVCKHSRSLWKLCCDRVPGLPSGPASARGGKEDAEQYSFSEESEEEEEEESVSAAE